MFRRTFSFVGGALLIILLVAGAWAWHIYAQRLQLEDDTRRELAHVAHELGTILSELTKTADTYFDPRSLKEPSDAVENWKHRNPYIANGLETRHDPCVKTSKSGLEDARTLMLPSEFKIDGKMITLPINTEAMFKDIVISDAVEYLLIADAEGSVMLAMPHGESGSRRMRQRWLQERAEQNSDVNSHPVPIQKLQRLLAASGSKLDPAALTSTSGSVPVIFADKSYQLHYYPFKVTRFERKGQDCSSETETWTVVGLVQSQRIWTEAATISPQWSLLLFLAIVIVVAGEPFMKLMLLSPTERFRLADACLMLPSATFLLMLATILVLDTGTWLRLNRLAAGGLESLAASVEANLANELLQMRSQLTAFDEHAAATRAELCSSPPKTDITNLLSGANETLSSKPIAYRDFQQISWANESGRQVFKATVHAVNTPRVDVSIRPYFTEPRDEHLWSFAGDKGPKFFVQPFRSITTSDLSTGLSMRSKIQCADAPAIIVMSGNPVSMEDPLLPAGYSFAIVNAGGRVLYHSDRRRSLKEDLFEEISDSERLHAALQAGTPQMFSTSYSRRRVELFIRPFAAIPDAGWFIVTLRDQQWIDTLNNEVLLRTLLWLLVPLCAPLSLALAGLLVGRKYVGHFWPDPKKSGLYRALAITYATVMFVGLLAATLLNGSWLFAWSLGFPLIVSAVAVTVGALWIGRSRRAGQAHAGESYRAWYIAAVGGVWAATAVVPATGLFRHSWQMETSKFDRSETARAKEYRRDWTARDRDKLRGLSIADTKSFFHQRKRYLEAYFTPLAEPANGESLDRMIDRYLPLYNPAVERLRYQPAEAGQPAAKPAQAAMTYRDAGVVLNAYSLIPISVVAFLMWLWLRYQSRHMLWANMARTWSHRKPEKLLADHSFVAFIVSSHREAAAVLSSLTKRAAAVAATANAPAAQIQDACLDNALIIEDFDCVALNAESRLEALRRLEDATASDTERAAIVSHRSPLEILAGLEQAPEPAAKLSASEKERWLHALAPFLMHIVPIAGHAPAGEWNEAYSREAYFDSLWRYCSVPERLTLIHVAQEGFANPRQAESLERLLQRGLLKLDPELKLVSPAFAAFVRRRALSPQVKGWESPEHTLGWRGMRWIFGLVLLAILVFVAGTQESWIKSATAMLTVLAGGLEAVWQLLRAVQKSQDAAS